MIMQLSELFISFTSTNKIGILQVGISEKS